ncbi:MAG: hypothetical protein ASARMPREDX12_006343 [Alectoria sarmentosa]|nr:MAG: hypothetical protein ASARMPREDX12_006343 [Alectoria sarmentosa]
MVDIERTRNSRRVATILKMIEKLTTNRGYLTYALLFYCTVTTLYWLPLVFSVKHRARLCQNLILPLEHQGSPAQDSSSPTHDFPFKIWQTAKTGISTLDPETQTSIQSWNEQNPNHRFEMITYGSSESYVAKTFAQDPALVRDFLALRDPVLRADLVRYLILYGDGGVYADLDTVCLRPIHTWVPAGLKGKVNMVIGIEGDSLGGTMIKGFSQHVGLGQATLAAKPGHFMMKRVIERVLSRLRMLAERQNSTLAAIEASYEDVIDTTGPGVFSECIYDGLSLITGTNVTSSDLTGLTEPRLIGDVLILPVTAFAPGVPHSNAGGPEDKSALVHHLYKGSWKADHPFDADDGNSEDTGS